MGGGCAINSESSASPNEIRQRFLREFDVELLKACPPSPGNLVGRIVTGVCRNPLARMAGIAGDFEIALGAKGIVHASQALFDALGTEISVEGRNRVPGRGALLIVSNHPGLLDTLALAVALERDDLKVVARQHSLWKAAPNLRERMIVLPETGRAPASAIRAMISHLESRGALLIYPSGKIDPDPGVFGVTNSGADTWSRLPLTLIRHVEAPIVPVVVYNVFSRRAYGHPLVWLHRDAERRHWLAATLQFLGGSRPPPVTHALWGAACWFDREALENSFEEEAARVRNAFMDVLGRVPIGRDRTPG